MAQFGRPDSNVTQTSFTNGFAAIDETTASDADFAYGANNTAAELEVGLSDLTDPASSTGHVVRFRIARTDDGVVDGGGSAVAVDCKLMQGATIIRDLLSQVATGAWATYEETLSAAEADAITDYADLRLRFTTTASGGSPANRRGAAVSWGELEVPDAAPPVISGAVAVTATATVSASGVRTLRSALSAVASASAVVAARLTLRSAVAAPAHATVAVAGSIGAVVAGAVSAVASGSATVAAHVTLAASAVASSQAAVAIGGAVKRASSVASAAGATVLVSARTVLRSGVSSTAAASVTVTTSGASAQRRPMSIRRSQSAVVDRLGTGNFSVN